MSKSTFAARLKEAMQIRGIKQSDMVSDLNLPKSAISQYLSGKFEAKQDRVYILANYLKVNEAWLMGFDVPMERGNSNNNKNTKIDLSLFDNITPVQKIKLPMLGEIACGKPIFADEQHETFIEVDDSYGADFCLKAAGDSMINAGIDSSDIVLIRTAPIVDNGEIAAVIIDDEATLKRVYYYKDKNKLVLQAENPRYEPLVYMDEELETIHILGKAVAVIKKL